MGDFIIKGLRKAYGDFSLEIPELVFRRGFVTGIVGDNGAGKTTLMRCMTGAIVVDEGVIDPGSDLPAGVVFDECPFPQDLKSKQLSSIFSSMFDGWDDSGFQRMLKDFGIDESKKVKEYSRGMRMKAQVAVALSHPTGILVLDEPTAGMDPAAREEFLDHVRDYMVDESHCAVISSHITSDIEKIADYVVFLKDGKIIISGEMSDVIGRYGILHAEKDSGFRGERILRRRLQPHGCDYLIDGIAEFSADHPDMNVDPVTLEDLMIIISKGEEA
ncbi:MAG: ABC transporter ATP-binding protein [Candidatus Methanomethylophilaceae archaeon]|nr:ABC transporter ATP-binding protein [Candidatus Methanomethylophilaceae archaeon]MBR4697973.1 ABC transporter ATP-binding protein [Candidatus Methanomethylophilaceae archaeon]